jgi:hypothetical protein
MTTCPEGGPSPAAERTDHSAEAELAEIWRDLPAPRRSRMMISSRWRPLHECGEADPAGARWFDVEIRLRTIFQTRAIVLLARWIEENRPAPGKGDAT